MPSWSLWQLLIIVFGGVLLVFQIFFALILLISGARVTVVFGFLVLVIGGLVFRTLSVLDRTSDYDAPTWVQVIRWTTVPARIIDGSLSLYETVKDWLQNR